MIKKRKDLDVQGLINDINARNDLRCRNGLPLLSVENELEKMARLEMRKAWESYRQQNLFRFSDIISETAGKGFTAHVHLNQIIDNELWPEFKEIWWEE